MVMTFVVTTDLAENFRILDTQRLGKQRVEGMQLINAIENNKGWSQHPAARMWANNLDALKHYVNCCIYEWIQRGNENTMKYYEVPKFIVFPWWFSWNPLIQSHRAMLYRKNPFYYHDKFTIEEKYHQYGYIWPHSLSRDDLDKPLSEICAPIPERLINARFCKKLLSSGKRKGEQCCRLLQIHNKEYCSIHEK